MTRAWAQIRHSQWWYVRNNWRCIFTAKFWLSFPRPGYCHCCGDWAWLTRETAARTLHGHGYLCQECAEINDREWDAAWAEYYSGRL